MIRISPSWHNNINRPILAKYFNRPTLAKYFNCPIWHMNRPDWHMNKNRPSLSIPQNLYSFKPHSLSIPQNHHTSKLIKFRKNLWRQNQQTITLNQYNSQFHRSTIIYINQHITNFTTNQSFI